MLCWRSRRTTESINFVPPGRISPSDCLSGDFHAEVLKASMRSGLKASMRFLISVCRTRLITQHLGKRHISSVFCPRSCKSLPKPASSMSPFRESCKISFGNDRFTVRSACLRWLLPKFDVIYPNGRTSTYVREITPP